MDTSGRWRISPHWIAVISLVYLAVHGMLFFSSWFTPWVALPLNLAILATIAHYARGQHSEEAWHAGSRELGILAILLIVCLLSVLNAGVAGYVQADSDIFIFREALLSNLIAAPWPLVLPDGQEMTYYLAGSLPGAMMARFFENYTLQRMLCAVWAALGLWLTFLLFFSRVKGISLWFIFFVFFFKEPVYLVLNSLAGNGDVWRTVSSFIPLPPNDYQGVRAAFITVWGSGQTYTFTPCTLLSYALLINVRCHRALVVLAPCVVALLVPVSPLAAIGCMPVALYQWFKGGRVFPMLRILSLVVPLCIVCLCAEYYLRAESDTCIGLFGTLMEDWTHYLTSWYAAPFLGGILFLSVLYPLLRKSPLLCISLACVFITHLVYFGSTAESKIFGNNEFWLKSSPMYNIHILAALSFNWSRLSNIKYIFVLSTLVMNVYAIVQDGCKWTKSPVVDDLWNGHLYHEHHSLYQKIPHCKPSRMPALRLKEGEAEKVFPGNILPKAPGCDYTRPAHWESMPQFLRV